MYFQGRPSLTVRLCDEVCALTEDSFLRAVQEYGVASVTYVSGSGDDEETVSIGMFSDWSAAQEAIRAYFERSFMNGDCWHLALAMHAKLGVPLAGVGRIEDGEWIIDHVFAVLDDHEYLDIRGVHETFNGLMSYRPPGSYKGYVFRPVTPDDIVRELDGFARDAGDQPRDWTNPELYEYASLSRQLVDVLQLEGFVYPCEPAFGAKQPPSGPVQ